MSETYSYKSGRVWIQTAKFKPYQLLLCYGMTDVSDPTGALKPVREPSPTRRRESVVAGVLRGDPDLPGFALETRLKQTLNYMLGVKCPSNFQAHLGHCDRPDNYFASSIGLHYGSAYRGDVAIDRLALIEGDDSPIGVKVPFKAKEGPVVIDFLTCFLSARVIAETESITDMVFLPYECFEDCHTQEDSGENGYLATKAMVGSPANVAQVWYTEGYGETWAMTSANPFGGGEDISCVIAAGLKNNHRVIVSRGTADPGSPAEVAYADVTDMGVTNWVNVNVGDVNGQYINYMFCVNWLSLFAVTNDGYVYKSDDGGVTWTAVYTAGGVEFYDVSALSDGTVWVVGEDNTIILSLDNGGSWTVVAGPAAGIGDDLLTCNVTPDGTVFIGNSAGEAYGSYDNGVEWHTMNMQGVTPTQVDRIRNYDNDVLWAIVHLVGGDSRVLRSTDGGAMWRLWSLDLPSNSGLNALCVVDANYVWVGGDPHSGMAFVTRTLSRVVSIS